MAVHVPPGFPPAAKCSRQAVCPAIVWQLGSSSVFTVQPTPGLIFMVRTIADAAGAVTVTSYACAAGAVIANVAVERPLGSRRAALWSSGWPPLATDAAPRGGPPLPPPYKDAITAPKA